MALRKCPGCKNLISAETESCPICGCEPRVRRLKQIAISGAAAAAMGLMLQGPLRHRLPGVPSPAPAQAQTAVPSR
jgi:hypothetical protein